MDEYNLNSAPTFTGRYRNASDVLTDPTGATVTYIKPSGVATTLTYGTDAALVRDSTGVYHLDLTLDQTGRWNIKFAGTGAVTASDPLDFIVGTTYGYCTLDELRDELGFTTSTDTTDDAKLARSINAASRQIDGRCGQRFWQDSAVVAREFYVEDTRCLDVLWDGDAGISTTTGLIVKVDTDYDGTFETTLTVGTDFVLLPRNAAAQYPVQPYTELAAGLTTSSYWFPPSRYGRPTVQITAKWGWPAVPDDINKACLVQAAQLFKAKDTAFDVAGETSFGVVRVRSGLNRTAEGLIGPYAKPAVG